MRHVVLLLLAMTASVSHAELLLTELRLTFQNTCCYASGPTSIGWHYYPNTGGFAFASVDASLIGVPQRWELGPNAIVSSFYRGFDWNVENPTGAYHSFQLSQPHGGIGIASLAPAKLFTAATYVDFRSTLEVIPHYTPPNGNSLLGTPFYFSALEFEVLEDTIGQNEGDINTRKIAMRFYGVPEPSSCLLLIMGCCLPQRVRHRSR
jgi:hypothetical protein